MFEYNPDKNYPKETESRVLIRFQDCDPLRHLNNAKYFDYFFNAREDQVPKLYGVEMMDFIRKYQAAWVIYNHNISYVKPANVGESHPAPFADSFHAKGSHISKHTTRNP